jgi:hypothetical protein
MTDSTALSISFRRLLKSLERKYRLFNGPLLIEEIKFWNKLMGSEVY